MSQNPGNFSYCFPADLNNLIITGKNPKKGPNRGLFLGKITNPGNTILQAHHQDGYRPFGNTLYSSEYAG